jgi:hypothetical protein
MRKKLSAEQPLLQVQVVEKTVRRGRVKIRRLTEPCVGLEKWMKTLQLLLPSVP